MRAVRAEHALAGLLVQKPRRLDRLTYHFRISGLGIAVIRAPHDAARPIGVDELLHEFGYIDSDIRQAIEVDLCELEIDIGHIEEHAVLGYDHLLPTSVDVLTAEVSH